MAGMAVVALDRPGLAAYPITERLRAQLVYFMTPGGSRGAPDLVEGEYFFSDDEVAKWLDEGVFYLVSPLDTANMTEVEITEEQELFLGWLQDNKVRHVRVQG